MKLKLNPDDSIKMLMRIPHKKFRLALPGRWTVSDDWTVKDCSLLWLFCWCKNGLNSKEAKRVAITAWNAVMPVSFLDFEPNVNHEEARKYRYIKAARMIQPTNE